MFICDQVGVDPVLRKAIWEHLDALCREDGLTVIITTHYIEEARTAETVGLMRFGRLLVQSNPEELLAHHGLPTLEAVFLKLCQLDSAQVPEAVKTDAHRYETNNNLPAIEMKKDSVPAVDVTVTNPDGEKQSLDGDKSDDSDKENGSDSGEKKPEGKNGSVVKKRDNNNNTNGKGK